MRTREAVNTGHVARGLPVVLLVIVASTTLAGCRTAGRTKQGAAAPAGPAVSWHDVQVDGVARRYRQYVPPVVADGLVPLFLVFHGGLSSAREIVETSQFDRSAAASGAIVLYPEGIRGTWNAGFCCQSAGAPDDVRFVSAILDEAFVRFRIDPARVFAVGTSAGAFMAYQLGCELGNRIAGVGSVAGTTFLSGCRDTAPVSLIEVHGTDDGEVPYGGGARFGSTSGEVSPGSAELSAEWAARDMCETSPRDERLGEVVLQRTWSSCARMTAVRLLTVVGGGHTWFSKGFGDVAGAVDATEEISRFLLAHPRQGGGR